MKTLKDLFEHQLKDLYNATDQMTEALPKIQEKASHKELVKLLEKYLEESKSQKSQVEKICKDLDIKPTGEKCKAMAGLITETMGFLKEDASKEVMDAGIIAETQRIAHYAITGFGTVHRYAKELKDDDSAKGLQTILDQHYAMDDKLTDLAEDHINPAANKK